MTVTGAEATVGSVTSFDSTILATSIRGADDGIPVLVSNAVGATDAAWRAALVDVVRERRVIAWHHRGLHDSSPAASGRLDPRAQAADALAVLDHHDVDRCAVVAWSNGTRIALELAAGAPERIACLILVSGAYGNPLGRLLRLEVGSLLPVAAAIGKHFADPLGGIFRRLVARPELTGFVRQSGLVGATADTNALIELLRDIGECDLRVLLESFQAIAGDSGAGLLHDVVAPTLIVVGDHDQFTSTALVEDALEQMPNATSMVYEGATHYLPLEYPAKLSQDLREFLDLHA